MASTLTTTHDARLNFRLSRDVKERIEKAAAIAGMSVSDFAASRLAAAADEIMERHNRIVLDNAERDFFLALLEAPDKEPTPEARRAIARYNALAATLYSPKEAAATEEPDSDTYPTT